MMTVASASADLEIIGQVGEFREESAISSESSVEQSLAEPLDNTISLDRLPKTGESSDFGWMLIGGGVLFAVIISQKRVKHR